MQKGKWGKTMMRILRLWAGVATASAAVLVLLASENRAGEGLSGATPLGEGTLIAARGLMPNYWSGSGFYICCLNAIQGLAGGWVCDCSDSYDGTRCAWCQGISALSGYYSTGTGSGVQPSGASPNCAQTMDLYVGLCQDGDCNGAFSGSTCSRGTYPAFDFQTGMNEGQPSDIQRQLTMATVSRR
jgi:hypothetical protein